MCLWEGQTTASVGDCGSLTFDVRLEVSANGNAILTIGDSPFTTGASYEFFNNFICDDESVGGVSTPEGCGNWDTEIPFITVAPA